MRNLVALGIVFCLQVSIASAQSCTPTLAGVWGGAGSAPGRFNGPARIAMDQEGNLYVTDENNNRVQKFNGNGIYLAEWSTGANTFPLGIAIDAAGVVYVALYGIHRIAKYTTDGVLLGMIGTPSDPVRYPVGVGFGSGRVYVASSAPGRMEMYDPSGTHLGGWGTSLVEPYGVAIGPTQDVYVSDVGNNFVFRFSPDGTLLAQWGGRGAFNGLFNSPNSLKFDASGILFVADSGNNRIQKFTDAGAYICQWGGPGSPPGFFNAPTDVVIDGLGQIYVTDFNNNRVQSFGDKPVAAEPTTWGRLKASYR